MQADNSFKTFCIMRTLKDIQTIYNQSGVKSLRDAELLQMIGIKTEQCDFTSILHANKEQLINNGIKPTTASKLEILGEIAHRYASIRQPERKFIKSSSSAAEVISNDLKHLHHEECWVLYLNRANRLLKKERLSIGGVSSTVVDVKLVVKRALELLASSLILVHNHPSGNCNPGDNDKLQTKILKDAAGLFDITLLDHLIIAGDSYFSFADDGLL